MRSGLQDGMTISFHHAFREGDRVINSVVAELAQMGFKGLTLASSSLMTCNDALIEHIQSGVIRRIYTSGMRGKLAEAISHGVMDEPVQIHSHGGRVKLLQDGELNIDVAVCRAAMSSAMPTAPTGAPAAVRSAMRWSMRTLPDGWCC